MAIYYGSKSTGILDGTQPQGRFSGSEDEAKIRRFKETIDLSKQAIIGATDAVIVGTLAPDMDFAFGVLTVSVTLGAAAVAIGTNPVHASNGQFRAAATATAVDAPALFGPTAAILAPPLTAQTLVYLTTSAALPATGIIEVDLYYSAR